MADQMSLTVKSSDVARAVRWGDEPNRYQASVYIEVRLGLKSQQSRGADLTLYGVEYGNVAAARQEVRRCVDAVKTAIAGITDPREAERTLCATVKDFESQLRDAELEAR